MSVELWRRPFVSSPVRSAATKADDDRRARCAPRSEVLGRLDDLGDEVLADADQGGVLCEIACIDGRALRPDEVALDRVAGEVIDLHLGGAALVGCLLLGGGLRMSAAHSNNRRGDE